MNCFCRLMLVFGFSAIAVNAGAQILPGDQDVKIGKLENGLTYYIRSYDNPKGKADFYIVHNAGSLQERDEQNGLAHFLEHMAFNGTKHYPEKNIINFLGQEGVRFGADINAFTAKGETVYHMARVPLVRESFVDSVLMVLHDWSGDITCDFSAVEQERGVIREEWRNRSDQKAKVFKMQSDIVYTGCPIQQRPVIGPIEVIEGANPRLILDFYHTWYRPDLQAVVIVGDFDADKMEAKVKAMFSDLKNPGNELPKSEIVVPPLPDGVLYQDIVDTSSTFSSLKLFLRQPYPSREVRGTREFYKDQYCRQIVTSMMSSRLGKATQDANCPSRRAVMVTNNQGEDFWVSLFTVLPNGDANLAPCLDFTITQMNSMLNHGVSAMELQNARLATLKKEHLLRAMTPESVETPALVAEYVRNFLYGFPITFPSELQKIQKEIIDGITMEDINCYIKDMFLDSEKIIAYYYNPKDSSRIPTTEEKKDIIAKAFSREAGPGYITYAQVDTAVSLPAGRVLNKKAVKNIEGTQLWTLSNGAKVYWTPLKNQKGVVKLSIQAVFSTGIATLDPADLATQRFARNYIRSNAAFGGVKQEDISNDNRFADVPLMLRFADKNAKIMTNAPAAKAETAFKLVHLQLAKPSYNPESLPLLLERTVQLERKEKSSGERFNEEFDRIYYANNPWRAKIDTFAMRRLNPTVVDDVFKREFGDMNRASFFIASELPEEQIEAYVCKYLASVPSTCKAKFSKGEAARPSYKGRCDFVREYPAKVVPKSMVSIAWLKKTGEKMDTKVAIDAMDNILSKRLLNRIRESEGGTYHVAFETTLKNGLAESQINFETTPDRLDKLVEAAKEEFVNFCQNGPTEEEMTEARATLDKKFKSYLNKKNNELLFRNATIVTEVMENDTDKGYAESLLKVNAKDVQKVANKMADGSTMLCEYIEK